MQPIPVSFSQTKKIVDRAISKFFKENGHSPSSVNPWSVDAIKRLEAFLTRGKTIRGSLVLQTYTYLTRNSPSVVLPIASAIELFHAGFLIHDDIMDRDETRRGNPTLHRQYALLAVEAGIKDADHYGVSQAISIADLCFFLGYKLIDAVKISPEKKIEITALFSRELARTTLAQMQDVDFGLNDAIPTEEEVRSVYREKTARYTFSLPMLAAGIAAGASKKTLKQLETLGELTGMIFQIRDDYLGIFGDPAVTGKPVGGDIREGKKTLYNLALHDKLQKDIRSMDIGEVQQYIRQFGIDTKLGRELDDLEIQATTIIDHFPISQSAKLELQTLVCFCKERDK